MNYAAIVTSSARKDLANLPQAVRDRVIPAVDQLQRNPWPRGIQKLVGRGDSWRLRVGKYRVVYSVFQDSRTVKIQRVRHRREAYR
ncbi:type II toxin-antitoxin system RelE/ParE family toxin [Candidatus Sumerlaeota bacterium]|nr:type II toxin-antitoxin system RelE/ParE family toxin [Candidatus Sumerlaeota bacterium]